MDIDLQIDRRRFLAALSGVIVSFGSPLAGAADGERPKGLDATRLDSWIAVQPDGTVIGSVGKIDAGMGIPTAFTQIVAEELDMPIEHVRIRMGDTATTVDQRGTGSSNGVREGGAALRVAAAQARATLLALGAERLGVAVSQLTLRDGVIAAGDRRTTIADVLDGRRFELALDPKTPVRPPADRRWVGKRVPRIDIPQKVRATFDYLVDFRLTGMLHARVLRPPTAGAQLLDVPAGQRLPGLVRIVARGAFLAVVCEREEQAVAAAKQLKVNWSAPPPMFPDGNDALYDTLRSAPGKGVKVRISTGDVERALADAEPTLRLDARYDYPFQSHACMGPACGVADVRADSAHVWAGGQKPYGLRHVVAEMTGLPFDRVRVTWIAGPGSYGMNDADDAAMDAAWLSREIGRPVRVQYMRHDAIAWDPKGPPSAIRMRGALAPDGSVLAFDYFARGYSGRTRPSGTDTFSDTLASQLMGLETTRGFDELQFSEENYAFANKRVACELVPWSQSLPTGLRTAHLRDPDGMATCFASESFVDELAALGRADPVAFRQRYLVDAREQAVLQAATAKAGWQARPSPNAQPASPASGGRLKGRGVASARRGDSVVAMVAEVEVDADTGAVHVARFVVAHDCGAVINPLSLEHVVESNLLMGLSRTLHEEVRFDGTQVTSVDWLTYPILDITEAPESIELVIVGNTPGAASFGAGEASTRPVAAVVANAIFDATGARVRRVPFTPERVLAAMRGQGVARAGIEPASDRAVGERPPVDVASSAS